MRNNGRRGLKLLHDEATRRRRKEVCVHIKQAQKKFWVFYLRSVDRDRERQREREIEREREELEKPPTDWITNTVIVGDQYRLLLLEMNFNDQLATGRDSWQCGLFWVKQENCYQPGNAIHEIENYEQIRETNDFLMINGNWYSVLFLLSSPYTTNLH